MRIVMAVCGAALALAGCSDPKAANKDNFKTAINDWIEKEPPCLSVPRSAITPTAASDEPFPRYTDARPVTSELATQSRQREQTPFDALVDAGLLTVKEATISVKAGLFGDQQSEIPVRAYDLSEDGKAAVLVEGEKTVFSMPSHRFCYGIPTVDEVVQFTEPADAMGVKVSQVSYRYHLKDPPDWATNEKMLAAFPQLARDTAESIEARTAVILTNEGWVHQKATRP